MVHININKPEQYGVSPRDVCMRLHMECIAPVYGFSYIMRNHAIFHGLIYVRTRQSPTHETPETSETSETLRRLARLFRVKITNTNTQRRKAGRDELSSCDEASEYLETNVHRAFCDV